MKKELKKEKILLNWKKVAIYNFKEWIKDAYNVSDLDILGTIFIKALHIKDYISSLYYEFDFEFEGFTLEELETFLIDIFIDKEEEKK